MSIRKIFKILGIIVLVIVTGIVLVFSIFIFDFFLKERKAESYHQKYFPIVEAEYIKLPTEDRIAESKDTLESSSCSFDHKMKAYRCSISFTAYYSTNSYPPDKIVELQRTFQNLDWMLSSNKRTREDFVRMFEKFAHMPSFLEYKDGLELLVSFLDNDDVKDLQIYNLSVVEIETIKNAILEGNYVYKTHISTFFSIVE